jgi:iron complex transport system permease protein
MDAVSEAAVIDEPVRLGMSRRGVRARTTLFALGVLLVATLLLGTGVGALSISPAETLAILGRQLGLGGLAAAHTPEEAVLLGIRLPRVLLAVVVGAGLAVSGAAIQGLFRNPLADPGLIGITSGAALAVTTTIVAGGSLLSVLPEPVQALTLPLVAFVGSIVSTVAVWRFATRGGLTVVATMLLAGVAMNALTGAATGLLTLAATDPQLRSLTFWALGSLNGATWSALLVVTPFVAVAVLGLPRLSRALNALLLGESEARYLGVRVERIKRVVVLLTALAVGATVAACGMIGFVGLVAPHLIRLALGADHRYLLPGAGLAGAILVALADVVARTIVAPAEIPIGIVTGLVGAPFFLWLLLHQARRGGLAR